VKNRRNYYRILHVQPDAPQAIIKASYRTLMQKLRLHPDLGGDVWNAALLNEAYDILSNPGKRAIYDSQFLKDRTAAHPPAGQQKADKNHNHPRQAASEKPHKQYSNTDCPFCGMPYKRNHHYGNYDECAGCNSPVQRINRTDCVDTLQRALQRIEHHAVMSFFTEVAQSPGYTATITDLSPRGLRFLSTRGLAEAQVIKIVCGALSATASIIYCKQRGTGGHYIVGAEFLTIRFHKSCGTFFSQNA
jgi:curved DNA-binding protein CbpA